MVNFNNVFTLSEPIFTYYPLIREKGTEKITVIFHSTAALMAAVDDGSGQLKLCAVVGYPQELKLSKELLTNFFKHTHLEVVRNPVDSIPAYVKTRLSLRGGGSGIGEQDVLPMYPGYALGNVIRKKDFKNPILRVRLLNLHDEMKQIVKQQYFDVEKASDKDSKQLIVNDYVIKRLRIEKDIKRIASELEELSQEGSHMHVNETLPIDHAKTGVQFNENAGAISEQASRITIKKPRIPFDSTSRTFEEALETSLVQEPKTIKGKIREELESFLSKDLQIRGNPTSFLSSRTMEDLIHRIYKMFEHCESVSLIGSFVTLNRVKRMDPITIRDPKALSDQMLKNADCYYVLTEAVLGGLFLGFSEDYSNSLRGLSESDRKIAAHELSPSTNVHEDRFATASSSRLSSSTKSEETGRHGSNREIAAHELLSGGNRRLAGLTLPATSNSSRGEEFEVFSYVCQGALPSFGEGEKSLWNIYISWRKALMEDRFSGYPIGYKVRPLVDIFEENGIEYKTSVPRDQSSSTNLVSSSSSSSN